MLLTRARQTGAKVVCAPPPNNYGGWLAYGPYPLLDAGAGTGRASGIVLFGFLSGLGIGPPIYGATVDATGSYTAMWLMSIGAAAITVGIVWLWRRTLAAQDGSAAVG